MSRRERVCSCLSSEWQMTHQILDELKARYDDNCTITKVYRVLDSERKYRLVEKDIVIKGSSKTAIWRLPV